jgi:hypothetical protein
MKNYFHLQSCILQLPVFSLLLFFISSCDTYNFSQPQPVDKENNYEFPKEMLGYWDNKTQNEKIRINTNNVEFITFTDSERIATGAWPRLNSIGGFEASPCPAGSLKTIHYDSLKRPLDTIVNYLVRGQYIYFLQSDSSLENGYPYLVVEDTMIILKSDTFFIDLGRNAFLRKLTDKLYVLNINNRILGALNKGDNKPWWLVIILQSKDKELQILKWTDKITEQPSMIYDHSGDYYFDSKWTAAEMMQLINNGNCKAGDNLTRIK